MLDKIVKYFLIAIIFTGIGYAWAYSHRPDFLESAKLMAMREIYRSTEAGIPFQFCLEDTDKCMRFIPRDDSRMKFIVRKVSK